MQVTTPAHLFAVDWEASCQAELSRHPSQPLCIFADIESFVVPGVARMLPDLLKTNAVNSILLPLVRDSPGKVIKLRLGSISFQLT